MRPLSPTALNMLTLVSQDIDVSYPPPEFMRTVHALEFRGLIVLVEEDADHALYKITEIGELALRLARSCPEYVRGYLSG